MTMGLDFNVAPNSSNKVAVSKWPRIRADLDFNVSPTKNQDKFCGTGQRLSWKQIGPGHEPNVNSKVSSRSTGQIWIHKYQQKN